MKHIKLLALLMILALSGCGSYDSLLNPSSFEPNRPNDPYQKCGGSGVVRQCKVWGASRIKNVDQHYENCQCVRL